MNQAEASGLSNLKISSSVIIFSPENQTAELTLTNLHQLYYVYFKIKTKIEKIFDVKPVTGCISPGQKATINFKAASPISQTQYSNLQQKLQFLIQAVNSQKSSMTKEEEDIFWKELKVQKTHMELGYLKQKIPIKFTDQKQEEGQYLPKFSQFQSKVVNKFSSNLKSESAKSSRIPTPVSHMKAFNFGQSQVKGQRKQTSDAELSLKYEKLKEKQQKLIRQREKAFSSPAPSSGSKKKSSNIMVIAIFVMMFFLGNLLKTLLVVEEPITEQKGFFDSLF